MNSIKRENDLIVEGYIKSQINEEIVKGQKVDVNQGALEPYNAENGIFVNQYSGDLVKKFEDGWYTVDGDATVDYGSPDSSDDFGNIIANIAEAIGDGGDWSQYIFDAADSIKSDKQSFIRQFQDFTSENEYWQPEEISAVINTVEQL